MQKESEAVHNSLLLTAVLCQVVLGANISSAYDEQCARELCSYFM